MANRRNLDAQSSLEDKTSELTKKTKKSSFKKGKVPENSTVFMARVNDVLGLQGHKITAATTIEKIGSWLPSSRQNLSHDDLIELILKELQQPVAHDKYRQYYLVFRLEFQLVSIIKPKDPNPWFNKEALGRRITTMGDLVRGCCGLRHWICCRTEYGDVF